MPDEGNGTILPAVEPGAVRRIHLVGVAGTGMGAFAGMLKAAGYQVTGSDENVYPPMSDMLGAWGIEVSTPYAAANLDRARPDLVIIGNVIRRVNPEATAVRERGIPQMSFPAAFGSLVAAGRHSIVVAGTHGKTTTAALLAHVLVEAGLDPTVLVGGVALNGNANFRLGRGPHVVVEGDEYDTAYFDKGPKFLHYRARTALLTSIEFDHADIYADLAQVEAAFARFCASPPGDGWLGVSASYPGAVAIARRHARAAVHTYGTAPDAACRATDVAFDGRGARFRMEGIAGDVRLPMSGRHNVENAVGVIAAARALGVPDERVVAALASFRGVRRRQEDRGEVSGVLVIDDFAHHPTAIATTLAGLRERLGASARILAVLEPRSNTMQLGTMAARLPASLAVADRVFCYSGGLGWDVAAALAPLGARAVVEPDFERLVGAIVAATRPGDTILVMSNGGFGGIHQRLLDALAGR